MEQGNNCVGVGKRVTFLREQLKQVASSVGLSLSYPRRNEVGRQTITCTLFGNGLLSA